VPFAVIPASGQLQGTTTTISHEIAEVVTDSDNDGWRDRTSPGSPEASDLCETYPSPSFHGNPVALFWPRLRNVCVAPPEDGARQPCLEVAISGGVPYCDGGNLEGSTIAFTASASIRGQIVPIAHCEWVASGAQIVGSLVGTKIQVTVPSPPGPFELDAYIIDANGCSAHKTSEFASTTQAQSRWFKLVCNLLSHIRTLPVHVNPLRDPLRDLALRPPTDREIKTLQEYSHVLNQLVEHLEEWRALRSPNRSGKQRKRPGKQRKRPV
jgi:hypothetical protein